MCAIAGIFHRMRETPSDETVVRRMNAVQKHRGPDADAVLVSGTTTLGNCRLAIIDRAGGAQPMATEDRRFAITYNGELFNFAELRQRLELEGERFRTVSDTEVVLRAYARWGPNCVERFNGQFAFAIWDSQLHRLFLARDHLGIHPLHYAFVGNDLLFASEAKALFEHPALTARLDRVGAIEAFLCGTQFDGRTQFEGIRSLEPGWRMTVTRESHRLEQYWDIPQTQSIPPRDESELAEELLHLVQDSLRLRLVGDVPWGTMLSGGTDSSTISLLAAQSSREPVKTFTIDFPNKWKGDGDAFYAAFLAKKIGADPRSFLVDPDKYFPILEQLVWHVERPFNKGAGSMYLLYERIQGDATVLLTGEGADELFGGYFGSRGLGLRELCEAGRFNSFPWAPGWELCARLFSDELIREYSPAEIFHDRLERSVERVADDPDLLNQGLNLYCKHFLLELLEMHDRTSLAFGIEPRLPFLDVRLVNLFAPLPSHLKVRDGESKYLLKKAVNPLLPPEIVSRKKNHMPIPRDPKTLFTQTALTRDLLLGPGSRSNGYFDAGRVSDFLERKGEFESVDWLTIWQISMYLITFEMQHRVFRI